MKITMLTASYRGGGAERVQITLAEEFRKKGQNVQLLVFEDSGALRSDLPESIETRSLGVDRVSRGILPLVRYLKDENPDIIIAAMTYVGTVALIAQMISRWRGKILVRGDSSPLYNKQGATKYSHFINNMLQCTFLPRAHVVIGVSTAITEELRSEFRLENCCVLYNPVAIKPIEYDDADSYNHLFDSGEPVIISIGRLHKEKGLHFLLESFKKLRNTCKAKLVILGEGEERHHLEKVVRDLGIESHVSLPGFADNPFALLRRSSVFALSSESEAFGLSLVEAMSLGIPIVSTDTEGPKEILEENQLGELVPFGQVELYAEALVRALSLPDLNREARIKRAQEFAPDRIASQYLRLIQN
ncbi:MAG: glycosyltransferase [Gammaproteobacteria bacterium]|nr:glycosyltransferase [Gammaproteobacteria bacterium]